MIGDRYQLDREIGRGGTGAVWVGRDTVLGRAVALKRLGMSHGSDRTDTARAEREAHLAARVHHHHVVAVYDLVDDGDHQWLVMEHVDGTTLAQLCHDGPLPSARVARLLAQVADALAAAHAHGIVHRDVKPSNVLVSTDDVAKLSDFGIARGDADMALTRTGLITGSPAYLSPEVARGRTATTASDVWAFGATLYHACTGHPPFAVSTDAIASVESIIDDTTPTLPATHPLAPVVAATLRRNPAERPTMREVADQLQTIVAPGLRRRVGLAELLQSAEPATEPRAVPTTSDVDTAPSVAVVDAHPTQHLASSAAPSSNSTVSSSTLSSTPAAATRPATGAATAPPGRHQTSSPRRTPWLVAAAVAAFLASAGLVVAIAGGDDSDSPDASPTTSATSGAEPTAAPTAAALEKFATDYLDAAGNDPSQGFSMLTPSYQEASGGLSGYQGFWNRVSNVQVQRIAPDVDNLRVTYIYSYELDGRGRTETVTLHLEEDGDHYLIAGADAI